MFVPHFGRTAGAAGTAGLRLDSEHTEHTIQAFFYYYSDMDTSDVVGIKLSDCVAGLKTEHKQRYLGKIESIGVDPYELSVHRFTSFASFIEKPNLHYIDIYNYLINTTSTYTGEALKAYKSLEAYSFFIAGWVQEVLICFIKPSLGLHVVKAKVSTGYSSISLLLKNVQK